MKMKSGSEVARSCLTLSDPMDCSLPGSSAHGIFQARVLSQMRKMKFKEVKEGTSLVVQWLRLRDPNAGGLGSIPGQGTRSHILRLKILNAATRPAAAK